MDSVDNRPNTTAGVAYFSTPILAYFSAPVDNLWLDESSGAGHLELGEQRKLNIRGYARTLTMTG
jgi:hypothetical protein